MKTYHDVEAVTRLLAEKEKDLELAAKIGQELLQRNKETEEKVSRLEHENQIANDTIIQLKHELQAKTDLLHVYTDDLEESSPLELRNINVEMLQRKIDDLEADNKTLHAEAFTLAQEAYKCEEKEEKLVKDAVQHLTQANYQIKDLHSQFTHKVDESSRQREEISQLLGQVCDLQSRGQRYSQETQDELTTELVDLKDKYREVVELLRDAQEDLRRSRKRSYPGMGKQTGMFTSLPLNKGDDSLQAEIHSSLHPSKSPRCLTATRTCQPWARRRTGRRRARSGRSRRRAGPEWILMAARTRARRWVGASSNRTRYQGRTVSPRTRTSSRWCGGGARRRRP